MHSAQMSQQTSFLFVLGDLQLFFQVISQPYGPVASRVIFQPAIQPSIQPSIQAASQVMVQLAGQPAGPVMSQAKT